jgi:hypothetical protein
MTDLERELEKALAGKSASDEVTPLSETAKELRAAFTVEAPEARSESILFTSAVGLRRRSPLLVRLLMPAVAVASVLVALFLAGRNALPGDSLYPVRGALKVVGLAEDTRREVQREIHRAQRLLGQAEGFLPADPDEAEDLASEAIDSLEDAKDLLEDVDAGRRSGFRQTINSLEVRARRLIAEAERIDDVDRDNSGPSSSSDNSGPGGGGDDDNSGSGSDDDNSGPGSGDDSDGDSSGSGSDDDSEDGDNSGSGSSGSSASGSSGSGSEGDDLDGLAELDDNSGSGSSDD